MVQLTILGAGTPVPSAQRFGTSFVAEVDGEHLMFDCGPAATHKLVKAGLWPTQIDRLFFTHHHYDHNVDYPCLLLNRWDMSDGSHADLKVAGPAPTTRLTDALIGETSGAFWDDINARVNDPGSQRVFLNRGGTLPRRPPRVDSADIAPGHVVEADNWRITTSDAEHAQPYLDSIAYRLETDDGSIVFTGDTGPCEQVIRLARDADLLVCMCWDQQDRMEADLKSDPGMCGSRDAAKVAEKAGVRQMLLVHSNGSVDDAGVQSRVFDDVDNIFRGTTVVASELMRLNLDRGEVTNAQRVGGEGARVSAR